MKKNCCRIISLLLILVMLLPFFPASASAAGSGNLGSNIKWSLSSAGTLTLRGTGATPDYLPEEYSLAAIPWMQYYDKVTSVVISRGITDIGNYLFALLPNLKKVSFPETLLSLGEGAFYGCTSLSSVTLPSGLRSLGDYVFDLCPLTSLHIPGRVIYMSSRTFSACGITLDGRCLMKEYTVNSNNTHYSSRDGVIYSKDRTSIVRCPVAKSGVFTVPSSVCFIPENAFFGCAYLTEIKLPATISSIEPYAFEACASLKSIEIPEEITSVPVNAFSLCVSLRNITLPQNTTDISESAFFGCESLESVIVPTSVKSIAAGAFDECLKLADVYYAGTPEQWNSISFGEMNKDLTGALIHYECESPTRLAGDDRCETAVEISKASYTSAENVVIASGDSYADALAGVPLAYALNAPILLIRNHELDSATRAEINRLGAKNAYILGGTFAVSNDVQSKLSGLGLSVTRLEGKDRFGTSVEIARELQKISGNPSEIFFTFSHNYPDALAISGIAAIKGSPILYIADTGNLTDETSSFVSDSDADSAAIISGPAIISSAAEGSIAAAGIDAAAVSRIYGSDRYETCMEINKKYSDILSDDVLCVATGTNYPDALAGGVFAALNKAPLLLAGSSALTDSQNKYVYGLSPDSTYIFGGTGAVGSHIVHDIFKQLYA